MKMELKVFGKTTVHDLVKIAKSFTKPTTLCYNAILQNKKILSKRSGFLLYKQEIYNLFYFINNCFKSIRVIHR